MIIIVYIIISKLNAHYKQKIANEFNKFSVNIGPHLAANIMNTRDPLSYVDTFMQSIFYLICLNMMLSILFCH